MLSTDLSTGALIFAVSCAVLSVALGLLCWVNARHARLYAANCEVWVQKVAKMRDPTAAVAALSSEMTELQDSYQSLLKSHKKLRSRIGMREVREKAGSDPGSDLSSETDKRQLRLAVKAAGLLK